MGSFGRSGAFGVGSWGGGGWGCFWMGGVVAGFLGLSSAWRKRRILDFSGWEGGGGILMEWVGGLSVC